MKIKRFNENIEKNEISTERVSEVVDLLKIIISDLNEKLDEYNLLAQEFSNFKNKTDKSNDQIDDSIIQLQIINKNLETVVNTTDNIIINLVNYIENGRKFLYTEKYGKN